MRKMNRITAITMVAVLAIGLFTGCNKKTESASPSKNEEEDLITYKIGISQSYDEVYFNQITEGFQDGLEDYFGKDVCVVSYELASEELSVDDIATAYIQDGTELIFANGASALTAAAMNTSEIPVVGAGVIDYQTALHIADDGWGNKTGTNVTGISSRPPVAAQLSLLIECTKNLKTVGILYSPDDASSIYQNEILENYLDQAGIPWKEYQVASTVEAITSMEEDLETESSGNTIAPSKVVAPSSREGMNNEVYSLAGENNVITGLNSEKSARTSKISKFWKDGGKRAYPNDLNSEKKTDASTEDGDVAEDKNAAEDENAALIEEIEDEWEKVPVASVEKGDSTEDIVRYACSECSALFISSSSLLNDQMETICGIATEQGVTTTGADVSIGEYTLTTLYCDPYDMGYRAAKLAHRILVNGTEAGNIKIAGVDVSDAVKLYQDSIAEQFGIIFPKSFTEFDEFLETYTPGDNTNRVNQE